MGLLSDLRPELPEARPIKQSGGGPAPSPASLRGNPELVRAAVAAIPNTSDLFPSREDFIQVGYAIKAAVADDAEAFDIFLTWCGRWDMGLNDPEKAAAEWRRMPGPYKRGANWLFELAQEYGGYQRGAEWFDEGLAMQAVKAEHDNVVRLASRFKIESLSDVADLALTESSPYLIQTVLDMEAASVVYGASNAGKTFVATDAAASIAAGVPYAGKKVRQGPVLYVAAEGTRGFRRRAAALRTKYGALPDFHVLMMAVNLFDPLADLRPLIAAVEGIGKRFVLIVVDTLARAMAGGDENSTRDMSIFVRNVDALRAATKAHLMLVHHTGKDETRGARGSSVLRAAIDTEIEVADGQIRVTKQRDLDKEWTAAFSLDVVTLGHDVDGETVTSCVVRLAADAGAGEAAGGATGLDGLGKLERRVFEAVAEASGGLPSGATTKEISELLADNRSGVTGDKARYYLRSLLAKGLIKRLRAGKWALKSGVLGSPVDSMVANQNATFFKPEIKLVAKSGVSIFD